MKERSLIALFLLITGAFLCLINPLLMDFAKMPLYCFATFTLMAGVVVLAFHSFKEYKENGHHLAKRIILPLIVFLLALSVVIIYYPR